MTANRQSQWLGVVLGLLIATPSQHQLRAQGTIAYFDPSDVLLLSSGGPRRSYELDFDQDGSAEFTLVAQFEFEVAGYGGNKFMAIPVSPPDLGTHVVPLALGAWIGPFPAVPIGWYAGEIWPDPQPGAPPDLIGGVFNSFTTLGGTGLWAQRELTAYMGAQFMIGADVHYGWVRIRTTWAPITGGILEAYAYNTVPGEPILAGAVPEPATAALLLGGGLAGLAFLRCRH
jgi:hypothetical protein